jgi:hypothetical protein
MPASLHEHESLGAKIIALQEEHARLERRIADLEYKSAHANQREDVR